MNDVTADQNLLEMSKSKSLLMQHDINIWANANAKNIQI